MAETFYITKEDKLEALAIAHMVLKQQEVAQDSGMKIPESADRALRGLLKLVKVIIATLEEDNLELEEAELRAMRALTMTAQAIALDQVEPENQTVH